MIRILLVELCRVAVGTQGVRPRRRLPGIALGRTFWRLLRCVPYEKTQRSIQTLGGGASNRVRVPLRMAMHRIRTDEARRVQSVQPSF